jgi:glycosyltransferase involved in cell wall biosynthesis
MLESAGISVLPIKNFARDVHLGKEVRAFFELVHYLRQFRPDVVHLNSSKAGGLGSLAARLLRVPHIVFTVHGWPWREERSRLWRTLAWLGSYVTGLLSHTLILVSDNDYQATRMPFVRRKCAVIHTAVAPLSLHTREAARALLFPPEVIKNHQHNLWLITHGELNHNKNHTTAIDAIAEFNSTHQTKIFYTIIGSGDTEADLKDQVELKGLTEYVQFLGYQKDARRYLLAFDMYLMSSKKEGLPYALLEAAAAGLPCIASRVGGLPEVIIDYQTGLLIDPNNHMTIVQALDYLLTNADKRSKFSNSLTNHLHQNFSLDTMIANTISHYER